MVECPENACDFTSESERGVNIHHTTVHKQDGGKITKECDNCDNTVSRYPKDFYDTGGVYCSSDCYHENNGGTVTRECPTCGSSVTRRKAKAEKRDHFFCDQDCYTEWKQENYQGSDNPSATHDVSVSCCRCGAGKTVTPSRYMRNSRFFCDRDCRGAWMSENRVEEQALAWKGGEGDTEYLGGWTRQRERALERDFYECRVCGMSNEEHNEEHGMNLHVHHQTPKDSFERDSEANRLTNLLTVCAACHKCLEDEITTPSEVAV